MPRRFKRSAHLAALEGELTELTELERAELADWLRLNPNKRPDATSKPVRLRKKIAEGVAKREGLAAEIHAHEQILEEMQAGADAERQERELREAEKAIQDAEAELAHKWSPVRSALPGST